MADALTRQHDPAALTEMHQDFVDSHWDRVAAIVILQMHPGVTGAGAFGIELINGRRSRLPANQLADLYRQREQEQKGLPDDEKLSFHAWFDQRIREANLRWLKTDAPIRKHDGSPIEYQAALVRQGLWNNWLLFKHEDREINAFKEFVERGLNLTNRKLTSTESNEIYTATSQTRRRFKELVGMAG